MSFAFSHFGVEEERAIYPAVQRRANEAGNETAMSAWCGMDTKKDSRLPLPKIDQLVEDAKAALRLAGIETEGKRSDEILNMAREERNKASRRVTLG